MRTEELFEIASDTVRYEFMTIDKLYKAMTTDALSINPNPIGQRPSTFSAYQNDKNVGIIESILRGYGVDTICLRDITVHDVDHYIRTIYPNAGYLTIDGGHRCRAVRQFIENKFYILIDDNRVRFIDLQGATKSVNPNLVGIYKKFMNTTVAIKYIVCDSIQAHRWFLMINKMTKTNEIESVMSDDESLVTKFIRHNTWYVKEYDNRKAIHPIFHVGITEKSEHTTNIWKKANTGGWFYYHALVTLAKSIGKGNVNAGEYAWKEMVADNYRGINNLTPATTKIWRRFFDDLHEFQSIVQYRKGLDDDHFGFFSAFWFHLFKKHRGNFKLKMDILAPLINRSFVLLTVKNGSTEHGKHDDRVVLDVDGNKTDLKRMVGHYVRAFSYGDKQEFLGDIILREIESEAEDGDTGITIMDKKRSLKLKDKELIFHAQGSKCWVGDHLCKSKIAGKKLKIDDCVLAHDIAYSRGGKAENGVILCKLCHAEQGLQPLDVLVEILEGQAAPAKAPKRSKKSSIELGA